MPEQIYFPTTTTYILLLYSTVARNNSLSPPQLMNCGVQRSASQYVLPAAATKRNSPICHTTGGREETKRRPGKKLPQSYQHLMLIVPRTDNVLDSLFIDRELSKDINSRINAGGVPLFSSVY